MKKEVSMPNWAVFVLATFGLLCSFVVIYGNDHLTPSTNAKDGDPLLAMCMAGGAVAGGVLFVLRWNANFAGAFLLFLAGFGLGSMLFGTALCYDTLKWVGPGVFTLLGLARAMKVNLLDSIENRSEKPADAKPHPRILH